MAMARAKAFSGDLGSEPSPELPQWFPTATLDLPLPRAMIVASIVGKACNGRVPAALAMRSRSRKMPLRIPTVSELQPFLLLRPREGIYAMSKPASAEPISKDQPCFDTTAYGNGPNDAVTDATENAAITHHQL